MNNSGGGAAANAVAIANGIPEISYGPEDGEFGHRDHLTHVMTPNPTDRRNKTISNNDVKRVLRKNKITGVFIFHVKDGITEIEGFAFREMRIVLLTGCKDVKKIGNYAFDNCSFLKSVPTMKLEEIGAYAFSYCQSLKTFTICETLNELSQNAFRQCSSLIHVNGLQFVKNVPESCFLGCSSLRVAIFSQKLEIIQSFAFSSCHHLFCIILPNHAEIDTHAFWDCSNVHVVMKYDANNNRQDNLSIQELTTDTGYRRGFTIGPLRMFFNRPLTAADKQVLETVLKCMRRNETNVFNGRRDGQIATTPHLPRELVRIILDYLKTILLFPETASAFFDRIFV